PILDVFLTLLIPARSLREGITTQSRFEKIYAERSTVTAVLLLGNRIRLPFQVDVVVQFANNALDVINPCTWDGVRQWIIILNGLRAVCARIDENSHPMFARLAPRVCIENPANAFLSARLNQMHLICGKGAQKLWVI